MTSFQDIYIHVPFCRTKCAYCAFYSATETDPLLRSAYLEKLAGELEAAQCRTPLETLYLGGGTPSLLTMEELERLFKLLRRTLPLTAQTEISMECNPETLTPEKCSLIASFCNRISLGVQSFQAENLIKLGRKANVENIFSALSQFSKFSSVSLNCDLIYGLIGQTQEQWQRELETALNFPLSHLSCYSLTLEENTRLTAQLKPDLDSRQFDELSAQLWEFTGQFLERRNMPRYEISNYARPGKHCRHNERIWRGVPYLGLGPAATSFDGDNRWTQVDSLSRWLREEPPLRDILEPEARLREIFFMNLRTTAGWSRKQFEALPLVGKTASSWKSLKQRCEEIEQSGGGLFRITDEEIRLTELGLAFWNYVAEELL